MDNATDMSTRYWNMTTLQLKRLKSEKEAHIARIERKQMGYFDIQEVRKLRGHLRWINSVLEARALQMPLDIP